MHLFNVVEIIEQEMAVGHRLPDSARCHQTFGFFSYAVPRFLLMSAGNALHLLDNTFGCVCQVFLKPLQHGFAVNLMHCVMSSCLTKLFAP